jgi:hypothetical protein
VVYSSGLALSGMGNNPLVSDQPDRKGGTHLPLTSYRHSVQAVADHLEHIGFNIYATVLRAPDLEDETAFQGFVLASGPTS